MNGSLSPRVEISKALEATAVRSGTWALEI